jgi:hypothetical protein
MAPCSIAISALTAPETRGSTHANGKSELATVDSVVEGDFPAVYVTYTDRTSGRVSPSQVEAV